MGQPRPEPLTHGAAALETRLGWLGVASAVFDLATVYIKLPAWRPGVTVGDVIDFSSAYILAALYAWVAVALLARGRGAEGPPPSRGAPGWARALLLLSAVTFVLGRGVHLSANSIHDALERSGLGDPGRLVSWWDETLGHVLIDSAKLGFCVGLTVLEAALGGRRPPDGAQPGAWKRPTVALFAVGAFAYGFIYFASGVEGQTVPLLLPFSVLYLAWALAGSRAERRAGAAGVVCPVRRFFATGFAVATALFAVWGLWHGGFPEFSSAGLIP